MTYTVATANGWKVVLGNLNYPIRYWNGTDTNFSLSDAGDVVAKSLTVSQKDDNSAMLTLRSTTGTANAYVMELFQFSGGARRFALDEVGTVYTQKMWAFAEFSIGDFPGTNNPSVEIDGENSAIFFGPGGAGTADNSLGYKASGELQFNGGTTVYWGTSVSSRLDSGNGIILRERTAPGTPAANTVHLYAKDTAGVSRAYYKDDAGVEHGPL